MTKVFLNIGLNVGNTEPTNQLNKTLLEVLHLGEIQRIRVKDDSLYEAQGIQERALIIELKTHLSGGEFHTDLTHIAANLQQDSIAFEYDELPELAFSPDYTGERYSFSYKYFSKF